MNDREFYGDPFSIPDVVIPKAVKRPRALFSAGVGLRNPVLQLAYPLQPPFFSAPPRLRGKAFCYNTEMPFRQSSGFAGKKNTRTPPPDDTGMESTYLKGLGEKQTPVMVKLHSGETFRGWIEYYDVAMVRLTREGAPNLFIFKHEIMYIAEDNGRRAR